MLTNISAFVKRATKDTLALNVVEEISVENDLRPIGVIVDQDDSKESKDTGKKSQAPSTKTREKYPFYMDNFTKSLKFLTIEVYKLKRKSSEAYTNKNYFKLFLKKNFNQLVKSTIVMPLFIAKNINAKWEKIDAIIIQLDISFVPTIGELNNFIIILSFDERVHQCIDIVTVDILDSYGLLLSTNHTRKLQEYSTTDWSHLWLLYKGKNNQIQVESEPFVKHIITVLETPNELIIYVKVIFGLFFRS